MNAQGNSLPVSLVIDGRKVEAKTNELLIEVMDREGIAVPRFCYHPDLSIVASCRMCLVEIENSPRLQPSCATLVSEGMCISTKSLKTKQSQQDVLKFLLINHPLDCPICDQGGECDLQDLSIKYGQGSSNFCEEKRAFPALDLGPLVATHMTRCIQCSRCVRFSSEVANQPELAWVSRGDQMHIESSLKGSMHSPLSGNMIDLCPVGALTSKPGATQGRSWSYHAHPSVSPHDCMGSQLWWHIRQPSVSEAPLLMRVVPRTSENINHIWLSDRDRYSYLGYLKERLSLPMLKREGQWHTLCWEEAYAWISSHMASLTEQEREGALAMVGMQTTMEEGFYLQRWWRDLGFRQITSDLRVLDDRDQAHWSGSAGWSIPWQAIADYRHIFILGGDIAHEVPLLSVRLNGAMRQGVSVCTIGDMPGPGGIHVSVKPSEWVDWLNANAPENPSHAREKTLIILSLDVWHHPEAAVIRQWMLHWQEMDAESRDWVQLTDGPNSAGLQHVGCSPLNDHLGRLHHKAGMSMYEIRSQASPSLIWMHGLDGLQDTSLNNWLSPSSTIISVHCYDDPFLREHATLILPLSQLPEKSGQYCSAVGHVSAWAPVLPPLGEAKSGSEIYRSMLTFDHSLPVDDFNAWLEANPIKKPGLYEGATHYARVPFSPLPRWSQARNDPLARRATVLQEAQGPEAPREETYWVETSGSDDLKLSKEIA